VSGTGAVVVAPADLPAGTLAQALPSGVQVQPAGGAERLLSELGGPTCKDESKVAGAQAPLSAQARPPRAGEPRLWVAELPSAGPAAVDVGVVSRDQPSEHVFTIQNVGTAELRMVGFMASCGCTRVEAESKVLAPGASTPLHVTYNPIGVEEYGDRLQKMVRIRSNDPLRPLVEFAMTGTLAPVEGSTATP
jgi:hypothetical protein